MLTCHDVHVGLEEILDGDLAIVIWLHGVEGIPPQVLLEVGLELQDISVIDCFFFFEKYGAYSFVCLHKVFITGLDCSGIKFYLVLLLLPSFGGLSDFSQGYRCLVKSQVLSVLLKYSPNLDWWCLEEHKEEEELSEGDHSIVVHIDSLQDLGGMLLDILIRSIE